MISGLKFSSTTNKMSKHVKAKAREEKRHQDTDQDTVLIQKGIFVISSKTGTAFLLYERVFPRHKRRGRPYGYNHRRKQSVFTKRNNVVEWVGGVIVVTHIGDERMKASPGSLIIRLQ